MTTGANIRELRQMENLTQAQLAEILQVSKETICRWEKERCAPRREYLEKIQRLFGITEDDLLSKEHGLAARQEKNKIIRHEDTGDSKTTSIFPVISTLASVKGTKSEKRKEAFAPSDVSQRHPHSVFVKMTGTEMSKLYPPGALLLVDMDMKPWNGCSVFAIADRSAPVIRRFASGNDMVVLSSYSYGTASPDLILHKRRVRILGVIIWFQASHDICDS